VASAWRIGVGGWNQWRRSINISGIGGGIIWRQRNGWQRKRNGIWHQWRQRRHGNGINGGVMASAGVAYQWRSKRQLSDQ
jgi:hypothetical protein